MTDDTYKRIDQAWEAVKDRLHPEQLMVELFGDLFNEYLKIKKKKERG